MDTSIKLFWFSLLFLAQSLFVYGIAHSDEGDWQHQTQVRTAQRWGEPSATDTLSAQNITLEDQKVMIQEATLIPESFIIEEPNREGRARETVTTVAADLNRLDFNSARLPAPENAVFSLKIPSRAPITATVCTTIQETQETFCHVRSPSSTLTLWFTSDEARATALEKLRDPTSCRNMTPCNK